MDSILITLDNTSPLYMQIYSYFKKEIESGYINEGERLPSIRQLAKSVSVSKITVTKAYDQLFSEGYIENKNRARYTVAPLEEPLLSVKVPPKKKTVKKSPAIKYDFSSGEMDPSGFDFSFWRRYLNRAFDNPARLMRYGHPQGEPELRAEIARYVYLSRGVNADPDQIIIGSSAQTLLTTLCTLLDPQDLTIAFEDPGFRGGRQVFLDHGFSVKPIGMKENGIDMKALSKTDAKVVYVSPSHQFPTGLIMSIGKRNKLLSWAKDNDSLIIEDDYDSEFRYYGNPIPALKGLDHNDQVVYIGSFSKIIPPSIRISYMLLPSGLFSRLENKLDIYNQSASTLEQLALAMFIQDGSLDRQIRRLRKKYQDKRLMFLKSIKIHFGDLATVTDDSSGLFVVTDIKTSLSSHDIKKSTENSGCKIALMEDYYMKKATPSPLKRLILYFSSIPISDIDHSVSLLRKSLIK